MGKKTVLSPVIPILLLTPRVIPLLAYMSHQNVDVEIWVAPEQSESNDAFGERWVGKRWTGLHLATGKGRAFSDFSFFRWLSLVCNIHIHMYTYIRMLPYYWVGRKQHLWCANRDFCNFNFSSLKNTTRRTVFFCEVIYMKFLYSSRVSDCSDHNSSSY